MVDVGASFPSDGQAPVLVEQGEGLLNDPAAGGDLVAGSAAGDVSGDMSLPQFGIHTGIVVPLSAIRVAIRRRGRPGRPRRGRTRSSSVGSSRWSLTLAADSATASGKPFAQVRMWCLDPVLARSTGLGPVAAPLFSPARASRRPLPGRSR